MLDRIRKIVTDPGSLGDRAINAGLWNLAALSVRHPMRLLTNLVMTRMLAPEAFALMATVTLAQLLLTLISDVGIRQAVVRSDRGEEVVFLRTAWTMTLVRGVGIAVLLIGLALAVQAFGPTLAVPDTVYADPLLPLLLLASVPGTLFLSASSANLHLAERRLTQRYVIVNQLIAQLVSILVMIGGAMLGAGVWALLAGMVVSAVLTSVLSHLLVPGPRMALAWDRPAVAEIWSFGKWLVPGTLGGFLVQQGDRLLFSFLLPKEIFGLYAIATLWIYAAREVLNRVGAPIFMPVFSEIRRRPAADLGPPFRKILRVFGAMTAVLAVVLVLFAEVVMPVIYVAPFDSARFLVLMLVARNLWAVFQPVGQLVLSRGDSRFFGTLQIFHGLSVIGATYAVFALSGFSNSLLAFALSSAPTYLVMLGHPEVRRTGQRTVLLALVGLICLVCIGWYAAVAPGIDALLSVQGAVAGG